MLSLCRRYRIHFSFIEPRSGPSRSLCAWLHLVIFFFHPCTFALRSSLTSRLGLRVFPPAACLIAAPSMIASRDQSVGVARAGGSAYHTCCRIKGHPRRSGIIWEEVKFYFLSFLFCFGSPHDPGESPHSHATSQSSPHAQVLAFKRDEGGLRLANRQKQQTDRTRPWAAGFGKRALKRLQGQRDVGTASVSRVWWKQWPNQRRLMSDAFSEVTSIY